MDKKLEDLLETIVSAINEFKKSDDQVRAIAATDEPKKEILFHWDDIAEVMGVAGLNYGVRKQLEIMADYYKQFRKPIERTFYYPFWDCLKNEIHVYSTPDHIYIDHPEFYDLGLLNMAYNFNRELFKQALAPKQS
jgi:hypothetical protein